MQDTTSNHTLRNKIIYHNPLLYAPLKRVRRDHGSRQVKMAT
ncbi:hypothetical protein HMPREF9551_00297, partial [Escherichia coli MS 196-1]